MATNEIKMVVGSWYRYNNCGKLSLGSSWIDLDLIYDEDDLREELEAQGFDLDGVDEELFIQDIEGYPIRNADSTNPFRLLTLIKESQVLEDEYKYNLMQAYCEVNSSNEWETLVEDRGSCWSDDMGLYEDQTIRDIAEDLVTEWYPEISGLPDTIKSNIDFEEILKEDTCYTQTSYGVLYDYN